MRTDRFLHGMFLVGDCGELGYSLRDHIQRIGMYHVSEVLALRLIVTALAWISSISVVIVDFGSSVVLAFFVKAED